MKPSIISSPEKTIVNIFDYFFSILENEVENTNLKMWL